MLEELFKRIRISADANDIVDCSNIIIIIIIIYMHYI